MKLVDANVLIRYLTKDWSYIPRISEQFSP